MNNTAMKKYGLNFNKSITNWDEAIPLGNGMLGCLIYGEGPLTFAIDRIDLWDERPREFISAKEFNYKNLIKYCTGDEKDWKEKQRIFEQKNKNNYPTKLSAGRIYIDLGFTTKDVSSKLDIYTAEAQICAKQGTNKVVLNSFICATKQVGVIKVKGEVKLSVRVPEYFYSTDETNTLNYPDTKYFNKDGYVYYIQNTCTDYSFGVFIKIIERNGFNEIFYTVANNEDDAYFIDSAKVFLTKMANIGYDALFAEHKLWWKKYWNKSSIRIADEKLSRLYYINWYLFASTSRKGCYPMPLQGVWTADNDVIPPWRGDYHHDTNTELSYQGYLKANRLDEGRVFVDYIWSLRNVFKKHAKKFYGVNGYLLPGTTTLNGSAVGGWVQFSLSPTLSIWVAQSFVDYYLYTDDKKFLKTRLYPFLKGVGSAIKSLLVEKDGKLYLPLSTSPEIYEEKKENFLRPNTNFDLALLIYLYQNLSKYSKELGFDYSEYDLILSKLDDIAINDENIVMMNRDIVLPFSHRHFSHLMCLYPLHLINYDNEKNIAIYQNTMLQIEQLGTGWWVGFSFPMCAQIYAMMYNGNAAAEKLKIFEKAFVAPNGFHLNGDYKNLGYTQWHYRPFTLEASFAFCDTIEEMLMQDHKGFIELFPAIPDEWKEKCSFVDLRSRGGVLVSAKLVNGKVVKLLFKATKNVSINLKNNFAINGNISAKSKHVVESYNCNYGDVISIKLKKGNNVVSFD